MIPNFRIAIAAIATTISISTVAGEDRSLEGTRLQIVNVLQNIIRAEANCGPGSNCDPAESIFASPSRNGLSIQLFGVHNHELAARISSQVVALATAVPSNRKVDLAIYPHSKREDLSKSFLDRRDTFLELSIQGGNSAKR